MIKISTCFLLLFANLLTKAQSVSNVDFGWAGNSINTIVFRKNSLTSFKDTQFIAYYNAEAFVVIGKRALNSNKWQLKQTPYKGKIRDAHNSISIAVDGTGYLHVAWDHHGSRLRYAKSVAAGSLVLTEELPMTGNLSKAVTYPEFYNLPDGNLLFFYRDGSSGSGNLVINRYDVHTKAWTQHHQNLIDGEKVRNAYWQACVDAKGTIHLSWVWRESPDVASNHDMAYARSDDGGVSWKNSTGESYALPITAATAEYACKIPQGSELINQTSMTADEKGHPFIATYWRDSGTNIPQYHVIYKTGKTWQVQSLNFRTTSFSLSGAGTKRIPVSRPQILVWGAKGKTASAVIFRDAERGNKVSVALSKNITSKAWKVVDLTTHEVGSWEPTYDLVLWKRKGIVDLFVQKTEQSDAEGMSALPPQMISVLRWLPLRK